MPKQPGPTDSDAHSLRAVLAANLRRLREERGLSQERAAELAGLSLQYYQRIEWEKHNVPLDTLGVLAAAFAVSPGCLVTLHSGDLKKLPSS